MHTQILLLIGVAGLMFLSSVDSLLFPITTH